MFLSLNLLVFLAWVEGREPFLRSLASRLDHATFIGSILSKSKANAFTLHSWNKGVTVEGIDV